MYSSVIVEMGNCAEVFTFTLCAHIVFSVQFSFSLLQYAVIQIRAVTNAPRFLLPNVHIHYPQKTLLYLFF